jgi:hypothetical protein
MSDCTFSLVPFPSSDQPPDIKITGKIARRMNTMAIHYNLHGNLEQVDILPQADRPNRKDNLWEDTCFEFFLGVKDSERYWEFNLSPSGHWNVYRFEAYRQGMQAEIAFGILPYNIQQGSESLVLYLELDLTPIIQVDQPLDVAISSVIKLQNTESTYWTLVHPGEQADFHRRDSFTLEF